MGYMSHHAIVVTTWDEALIKEAHAEASELFPWVSPISPVAINGYRSFFVPPDGSKEGWPYSNMANGLRDRFVEFLVVRRCLDWVEVQFADDGEDNKITRHGPVPSDGY
jgi:hypothetical protein